MSWLLRLAVLCTLLLPLPARAQKNFGFDNRKPSGQPYWTAQESLKGMKVPPGWEVKLVAAEPDVINPIAFTIDERGRLWVLECFEYPKRTPKGKKPRDRIKIIEEDPKGGPPKVTIWVEGKDLPIGWDLASGLEVGHGGVFLGAPPYLFFIENKDGKPGKQEILLKGFGSQDTHETLNTFQWGPDSKLYGLHGIFTQSQVGDLKLNAAVWRYDVHQKKFDIFAEGTSNPWGMDFDARGNCFTACCVIPHLFHIVPGGIYKRQAGASLNPYAYGQLNEICDHTHHKDSGWAHAGLLCLDGDHVPEAYRGSVIMGSIHGSCIKRDVLRPNGSSFIASCEKDFLTSADKNFRPINLRWGPDGSIYVIDWHDQNPCHQTPPDAWDYERGRIYKITPKSPFSREPPASAPTDLGTKTSKELVTEYLKNDNPYYYRTALRLLNERREKPRDLAELLDPMLADPKQSEPLRLRALWASHACGFFADEPIGFVTQLFAKDGPPTLRAWALRLAGESGEVSREFASYLADKMYQEKSPQVRLQAASTLRLVSRRNAYHLLAFHALLDHAEDARDPCLPLLTWLAYEPLVTSETTLVLDGLRISAAGNLLVTNEIVPRTIRRLAATGKLADVEASVHFLGAVADAAVRKQALDGLVLAFKAKQVDPPPSWKRVYPELLKDGNKEIHDLARRLAVSFQDPKVIAQALALAADAKRQTGERLDAVRDVALALPADGLKVLQKLVLGDDPVEIRVEACRALASYDSPELAKTLLPGWKGFPPAVRQEAVNLLAGRKTSAAELLAALGTKTVARTDLTDNTILRIRAFKDSKLNDLIEKHWGRFRDTPKELNALLDKMRDELYTAPGSFARGKVVFDNNCAKCHKFDGRGFEVGPNLDGAARDIEYLLANVIDPNRVVGQPYYMRLAELKNGRIETGLLAAEDNDSITLKQENNVLKVIQLKDIEGKVQVQEKSVMPEGLSNNMTAQDFRDLVRYTMAHPFLTEVQVSTTKPLPPNAVNPLAEQDMKWQTVKVGPPGRIPLPAIAKGDKFVAVVTAEVEATAALRTKLLIGSSHSTQVWLNGKPLYNGQPGPAPTQPDQTTIDVELRAGRNEVLFQVAHPGENGVLYARFVDPERKLRQP